MNTPATTAALTCPAPAPQGEISIGLEECPRLRAGIEAAHHTTRRGAAYVVVRNPAAHQYLKLTPQEFALLPLLDGAHTVKALTAIYFRRHGVLALPRIQGLVGLLRAHGFLLDAPASPGATGSAGAGPAPLPVRLARGFLLSQFALPNVDAHLDRWYRAWGWVCFTRPAVLLQVILAGLGPILYLREWGHARYDLFNVGGSPLLGFAVLLALWLVVMAIHELGHALAVKHAGRHVPRAGLALYYGLPAAFADTTDIWMAPRRQRLLVSCAGPWTGLVLGGACGVLVALLPDGPLGAFVYTWGAAFLISNLLHFNPLLELDGYYLLIDLLEQPRLRSRALAFVRTSLAAKLRRRERFSRAEVGLALFGLASAAFSLFAIGIGLLFWQRRLGEPVLAAWLGGDALAAVGGALLGLLILLPVLPRLPWRAAWPTRRRHSRPGGR